MSRQTNQNWVLSGQLVSNWAIGDKHENLYKYRQTLYKSFYLALYKDITGVTGYIYFCGYKSQSKFIRNVSSPVVDTQCCWEWESVMLRSAGAVLCMSNITYTGTFVTFKKFSANAIKRWFLLKRLFKNPFINYWFGTSCDKLCLLMQGSNTYFYEQTRSMLTDKKVQVQAYLFLINTLHSRISNGCNVFISKKYWHLWKKYTIFPLVKTKKISVSCWLTLFECPFKLHKCLIGSVSSIHTVTSL